MLKIVMEDMPGNEVAALYEEGNDAVVLVSRHLDDDTRCQAINELLARVSVRVSPRRFPKPVPHAARPAGTEPSWPESLGALRLAR